MIEEIIGVFSIEELAPKLLEEKDADKRDILKGQLLAYNDFKSIDKVYVDKGFGKLKEYLERFDPYAENLNLLINIYDTRAEAVISSKIKTLLLLKTNTLSFIDMQPKTDETTNTDGVSGDDAGKDKEEKNEEPKSVESEVSNEAKRGK